MESSLAEKKSEEKTFSAEYIALSSLAEKGKKKSEVLMVMKKRIKHTEEAANSIFHTKNYFVTMKQKLT